MAAHHDQRDEQCRHDQPRNDPRQPQFADRGARNHRVKHQNDRRRDQNTKAGACLNNPRHHLFVIAPAQQFRQGNGRTNRHARYRQPVHGGNQHHQQDRANGKAPPHPAKPDVEHPVQVIGQPGLAHHIAHKDKHRQAQQRIPFHQLHRRGKAHPIPTRAPKPQGRGDSDKADHSKDPLPRHHHQQHGRKHQGGDHFI